MSLGLIFWNYDDPYLTSTEAPPHTPMEKLTALSQTLYLDFRGSNCKEREGKEREKGKEGKRVRSKKGRKERERGKERGSKGSQFTFLTTPLSVTCRWYYGCSRQLVADNSAADIRDRLLSSPRGALRTLTSSSRSRSYCCCCCTIVTSWHTSLGALPASYILFLTLSR